MHSIQTFPMRAIARPHRSILCFSAQICRLLLKATAGAAARTAISIPSRCHDWTEGMSLHVPASALCTYFINYCSGIQ